MLNTAKRRALHVWIALLAILFSALAPALSQALAPSDNASDTAEICTVHGYQLVKLTASDSHTTPAPMQHGMQHCACCGTHAGAHALPAMPVLVFAPDAGRDTYPPLFYAAPQALHAWSSTQPRGPPTRA